MNYFWSWARHSVENKDAVSTFLSFKTQTAVISPQCWNPLNLLVTGVANGKYSSLKVPRVQLEMNFWILTVLWSKLSIHSSNKYVHKELCRWLQWGSTLFSACDSLECPGKHLFCPGVCISQRRYLLASVNNADLSPYFHLLTPNTLCLNQ